MALQDSNDASRTSQHHCRDCGVFFESGKSLEVHLQYHKENLLSKWANQAAAAHNPNDSENNNVKRREFQTAPADSTVLPTGPGRPSSTTGYPGSSSPFPHPHTPSSYASAPSPYQNDIPSNPGPSPSSTSYGYSNGDSYTVPYNGYARSPRSHPGYYTEQQQPQPPPDGYVLGPTPDTTPHSPSSSSGFRFFNKPCYPLDKNGVSSSSPNTCEKCGCVCESPGALADHAKVAHPPYGHTSAFQTPDTYYKQEPTHDSPDILDLDCQQKFRPPDEESANIPPVTNPHSVSAMLNPWPPNKYAPYPVTASNPQPFQNGSSFPTDAFPPSNVPNNQAIPSAPSPKPTPPSSGKGDSWKSNEARRPKTYNCSACNKWFTSSGHLKRHYNTTLHKNAVKQSGKPDPATLPISSHHHPNRDPSYIHSSKTPPGHTNPSPNIPSASRPKKAKSMSPQGDMGAVSPALSSANEGDSSRSGFGNYDMQQPPPPTQPPYDNGFAPGPEPFEYYRYENRLPQNSTNQIPTQPPNYQAGLSVSPSGDLPIYPHLPHSQPTPSLLTFMGENIMMPVESGQQSQVHVHPTTTLFTNNIIITGSQQQQQEPLPSFSQLVTEAPYTKTYYMPQDIEQQFVYVKSEPDMLQVQYKEQESFQPVYIKVEEPDDYDDSYSHYDLKVVMNDNNSTPPISPIEFPTSTNIDFEPNRNKPVKKKKKSEVSSNLVTSTSSAKPPIRCDECDKSFNRICYLTQHNKCFHSGVKPFKCERCGKRFHSELRARDHERRHGGVKPYRCEICPKSFNHKTDLRRHLCLHSGQKPFACSTCGKGFIRKDHMLKHVDTHKNSKKRCTSQDCGIEDERRSRVMMAK